MNEIYKELFFNNIIFDMTNIKEKIQKYKSVIMTYEFIESFELYINEDKKVPFIDYNISNNIYILLNYIRDNIDETMNKEYIYDIVNNIIIYLNRKSKKDTSNYYFNQAVLRNIDPCFIYGDAKEYSNNYRNMIYKTISQDFDILIDLSKEPEKFKTIFERKYKMINPNTLEAQIQYPIQFYPIYTIRIIRYIKRETFKEPNIKENLKYMLERYKESIDERKISLNTTEIELIQAIRTLERILITLDETKIKKTKQKIKR